MHGQCCVALPLHSPLTPSSHPDSTFLVLPKVTLWDTRASERRGCTGRMTPGGSDLPLYAIAADSTGTLIGAYLLKLNNANPAIDCQAYTLMIDTRIAVLIILCKMVVV